MADLVLANGALKPEHARRGIALHRAIEPVVTYFKPDPLLRYQWKFYDVAPR